MMHYLGSMQKNGDELDELHPGEVSLPPQVRLYLGSEGGQKVVRVHHRVDEGVQVTHEGDVAACTRQEMGQSVNLSNSNNV